MHRWAGQSAQRAGAATRMCLPMVCVHACLQYNSTREQPCIRRLDSVLQNILSYVPPPGARGISSRATPGGDTGPGRPAGHPAHASESECLTAVCCQKDGHGFTENERVHSIELSSWSVTASDVRATRNRRNPSGIPHAYICGQRTSALSHQRRPMSRLDAYEDFTA